MADYISIIISLIALAISTILIRQQLRQNYNLNLRNKSLEFSIYSRSSTIEARVRIEQHFQNIFERKEPIPINEIEDAINNTDKQILADILTILAHWENMALAIHSDVADEEVCFEMVANSVRQNVTIFHNFIARRQMTNERAYSHLIRLKGQWSERLSHIPKSAIKPIPKG